MQTQTGAGASEAGIPACNGGALCNHGSHVAGIAAGNGATFDGVARNADIISIQVFTRFNSGCVPSANPCVRSYTSDQLAALDYIFTTLEPLHTIASVNMSLGGGGPFTAHCDASNLPTKTAIDNLRSAGIATIIATGNNGWTNGISSPACISTAIAVGSTTDGDAVSIFSNVHGIMDLFAPGSAIESAVVGGGFANYNGTSMATPHVAGAWAVLKQANPTASVDDILTLLATTGVSVTDGRTGGTFTKPRIQLDVALAEALTNAWTGDVDTDWHNVGNWSGGTIPTCAANVTIPGSLSNYPSITANAAAGNLLLQSGAQLNMSDHTLTLCGNLDVQGTANFNMSGGTLLLGGTLDATLNLPASNKQLHHLQIGNGTDPKQVTLNSDIAIAGNFAISDQAVLESNGQEIRFNGGVAQAVDIAGTGTPRPVYNNDLSDITGWTIDNVNLDGNTWVPSTAVAAPNSPDTGQHARYSYNVTNPANDWLFSPGFILEAGQTYNITFNYGARSSEYPERLAVYIGNSNSIAAMTTQLFDNDNVINTNWAKGSGGFVAPNSGMYYVGFHAYSLADQWELAVDDLQVAIPVALFADWVVADGASVSLSSTLNVVIDNGLVVENGGTLDLAGTAVAVNGSVTNHGTLQDTLNTPSAMTTHFLHIKNEAGDTTRYRGVEITPSGYMGDTTVAIQGNQTAGCTTNPLDALLHRCFIISPQTDQPATIRFWFTEAERNGQAANALKVWHYDGPPGVWSEAGSSNNYSESGATCDSGGGTACWVEAVGVTTYSPFGAGAGASAPTAVSLSQFSTNNSTLPLTSVALLLLILTSTLGWLAVQRRNR